MPAYSNDFEFRQSPWYATDRTLSSADILNDDGQSYVYIS